MARIFIGRPLSIVYDFAIYGDSQAEPGATSTVDPIGYSMDLFTSTVISYNGHATGGWRLDQIKTEFDATYPVIGINSVLLQGGINDVVQDRSLSLMKNDMASMANAALEDSETLIIVGISPMGTAHASYTEARGQKIIDFNNWLIANFGRYYVDIYTDLEDKTTPRDLALPYQKSAVDLHLSDNGARAVDERIGSKLYTFKKINLTSNTANITEFPRDITSWSSVNCSIGGPSVQLADGTFSSVKGILSDDTASSVKQITDSFPATIADATPIVVKVLLRPGQFKWVRMQYLDNNGTAHVRYVNIIDFTQGAGTADWNTSKAAHGWVQVALAIDSGTGVAANNNIDARPATGDGVNATTAINTSQPLMYMDSAEVYPA